MACCRDRVSRAAEHSAQAMEESRGVFDIVAGARCNVEYSAISEIHIKKRSSKGENVASWTICDSAFEVLRRTAVWRCWIDERPAVVPAQDVAWFNVIMKHAV